MKIAPPTKAVLTQLTLDPIWTSYVKDRSMSEFCANVFDRRSIVKCSCAYKTLNDGCYRVTAPPKDPTCKYLCSDLSELREEIVSNHKRYYSETTTTEEKIEIDIALTSRFCRSFVPSVRQVNYWTYVTPTGEQKISLCSEGLCTLLGGKKRVVTKAEAEAEMTEQGIVFFQTGNNTAVAFRDETSKAFKKKFVPKNPRKGSKKDADPKNSKKASDKKTGRKPPTKKTARKPPKKKTARMTPTKRKIPMMILPLARFTLPSDVFSRAC